jgi:hypothetical protein
MESTPSDSHPSDVLSVIERCILVPRHLTLNRSRMQGSQGVQGSLGMRAWEEREQPEGSLQILRPDRTAPADGYAGNRQDDHHRPTMYQVPWAYGKGRPWTG